MQTHSPAVSGQSPASIIPIRAGIAITPNAKRPSYQRVLPKGIASLTAIRLQRQRDAIEQEIEDAITAAHERNDEAERRTKDEKRAATINSLIHARLSEVNHRSEYVRRHAKTVNLEAWVEGTLHRLSEQKKPNRKGLSEAEIERLGRLLKAQIAAKDLPDQKEDS